MARNGSAQDKGQEQAAIQAAPAPSSANGKDLGEASKRRLQRLEAEGAKYGPRMLEEFFRRMTTMLHDVHACAPAMRDAQAHRLLQQIMEATDLGEVDDLLRALAGRLVELEGELRARKGNSAAAAPTAMPVSTAAERVAGSGRTVNAADLAARDRLRLRL